MENVVLRLLFITYCVVKLGIMVNIQTKNFKTYCKLFIILPIMGRKKVFHIWFVFERGQKPCGNRNWFLPNILKIKYYVTNLISSKLFYFFNKEGNLDDYLSDKSQKGLL